MQPKWMRRGGLAAIFGLTAWASIGCAEERDAISRVQPNALNKSFFVGTNLESTSDDPEFYMRNTVVDVPYGAGQDGLFTATYAQPVNRIKWEIAREMLIARMTHERITNSDFKGSARTNDGQVVAMFAISSHFDIRRAYNPSTGEEINVVEENGSDRPWYQREHFRVDWSKNLVTDGYEVDTASMLGAFGGVKFNPLSYYVEEGPDAPQFDIKGGYFDITSKVFATPEKVDFSKYGYGMIPACFLTGQHPVTNCNSTEVTLRLSFKKVVDTDFEPSEWTGNKQDAFGVFTEDRYGYDRNYQVTDQAWHRYQAKYNTWEKSHIEKSQCAVDYWRDANGAVAKFKTSGNAFLTDPKTGLPIVDDTASGQPFSGFNGSPIGKDVHADANKNGTEDACEFTDKDGNLLHAGSRCDEFANKCTLPAYERTTKATPWYYGPDSPADLFSSTSDALNQWNVAVRLALQIRMKVEAERVGLDGSRFIIDEEAIKADLHGDQVPNIFVLCHNPVIEGDEKECGKTGLRARVGDLRYSMVNLIQTPQTPSPWGIMVDAVDPLTGEKIAGSANEWVHVLDFIAQSTNDLLKWFNGELSDQDIYTGTYLHDWVESSKLGTAEYTPKMLDAKEIQSRIKSLDLSTIAGKPLQANFATLMQDQNAIHGAMDRLTRKSGPGLDAQFEATRQGLLGSPLEAAMITSDRLQAAGLDPRMPVAGDSAVIDKASPLRTMSIQFRQFVNNLKATSLAQKGACMVEQPEPNAMAGLGRLANKLYPQIDKKDPEYASKNFARNKEINQWLRTQMHLGVIAHELGHSMGLRHNFTGTWDALNFHKEYWQLRSQNGKEKSCRKLDGDNLGKVNHTDGKECIGPRWVDPVTDDETNGLIWKWGTSTVMDYPGDTSQDFNGIGPYDKAAVRFFYGETVDVEANTTAAKRADYPGYLESNGSFYFSGKHYSEFNDAYSLIKSCTAPTDPNDPLTAKCDGPALDYVRYTDMVGNGTKNWVFDKQKRVRHPYMFNSDEFANPTNVSGTRFDSGADPYEKMQFLVSAYENRYIFDYFRRGRVQFNTHGVVNRIGDRYFDMITGITKSLGLNVQVYGELFGKEQVDILTSRVEYLLPSVLASADGFAMFARILTRPEPGVYGSFDAAGGAKYGRALEDFEHGPSAGAQGIAEAFSIAAGSGEGRYVNNDYEFTKGGYYWSDYQTRVGSAYEKTTAIEYMMEAYNRFVQVDRRDFVDGRWKNINYATLYPEQMRRLFSSISQSDALTMGPYVVAPAGGASTTPIARVQYPGWDKTDEITYPANSVTLDPLFGWEQQYPAMIYTYYYAPTTLTMDWYDQMRVFVKGGQDEVEVKGPTTSFEDPESRIVYMARDYGTETIHGQAVSRNSGARMLNYASSLRGQAYQMTGDAIQYDASGKPVIKDVAKATQLRRFVANLAVVRQMAQWFGNGPLGRGN